MAETNVIVVKDLLSRAVKAVAGERRRMEKLQPEIRLRLQAIKQRNRKV